MSRYQESQDLIADAESALRAGDVEGARSLFRQAGMLQETVLASLPEERVRTRSVFALGVASLYYRANALDEAERAAHRFLADGWLHEHSRLALTDLLVRIWNERLAAEAGEQLSGEAFSVTLRGGHVLYGLAPVEVADAMTKNAITYVRRMAAWCNNEQFTVPAPDPTRGLSETYRALQRQPMAASYRVDIHLAQAQLALPLAGADAAPPASPARIIDESTAFARSVTAHDVDAVRDLVDDASYRGALVRLVRQLVPNGRTVREVELRNSAEPRERAVCLRSEHRKRINKLVHELGPPSEPTSGEQRLRGVLRAVNLNTGILQVDRAEGPAKFEITEVLHDIVGPMLNKPVVVRAYLPRHRTKIPIAQDIDLDEEADDD
jgi:hypothetical protein